METYTESFYVNRMTKIGVQTRIRDELGKDKFREMINFRIGRLCLNTSEMLNFKLSVNIHC